MAPFASPRRRSPSRGGRPGPRRDASARGSGSALIGRQTSIPRVLVRALMLAAAAALLGLGVPAPAAHADPDPVTSNDTLPDAYLGVPYSAQLAAVGGVAPYQWNFVGGVGCDPMPPGLTVSETGLVSGTPTFAVGHCSMNMSIVDHSTSGTYHPVTVTITVQAVPPPCDAAGFAAAFNDAADGSVVTACGDLDVSGHPLTVPAGRDITIDLAGHSLTADEAGGAPALDVPAGTSMTIIDTSFDSSGKAAFNGITDDGILDISVGVQVTSNGTIRGAGTVGGGGTLQNNGSIEHTVTVSGIAVDGHNYFLRILQHADPGGFLENLRLYAATLSDAGISIAHDWPEPTRPGYALSGWYLNAGGTGAPLTDDTDFSTIVASYVNVYAGWSKQWYADSVTGDDAHDCGSSSTACKTIGAALAKAQAGDGGTIVVAAGTYGSAHGDTDLAITKAVTIKGASAATVTVGQSPDATAPAIAVSGGAHATISGMTLIGGSDSGSAGAVVDVSGNGSTLAITDSDVSDADPDSGPLYGIAVRDGAHADVSGGTVGHLPYGIDISSGGTMTMAGAAVRGNGNSGIVFESGAGTGSTIDSTIITGNGVTTTHGAPEAVANTAGVRVEGGSVAVTDATLRANSTGVLALGSGLTSSIPVTITGGTIDANLSGGITAMSGVAVSVMGTAITANNAGVGASGAAGVAVGLGATTTVTNAVISGNGVGISNIGGHVTVDRSAITGNRNPTHPTPTEGGGIQTATFPSSPSGPLAAATTVIDSAITGNQAGILATSGTTTVTDSTIADNLYFGVVADAHGLTSRAPSDPVTASLIRSTVAENGRIHVAFDTVPLAGVAGGDDGTVTLAGSLVTKGSAVPACAVDGTGAVRGVVVDGGYTLADDGSCPLTGTGSLANADLRLGALADNGSTASPVTQTMVPAAGSPALGRIPVGATATVLGSTVDLCAVGSTDQRGAVRPTPSGAQCDVGAAERDESTDAGATGGSSGAGGTGGTGGTGGGVGGGSGTGGTGGAGGGAGGGRGAGGTGGTGGAGGSGDTGDTGGTASTGSDEAGVPESSPGPGESNNSSATASSPDPASESTRQEPPSGAGDQTSEAAPRVAPGHNSAVADPPSTAAGPATDDVHDPSRHVPGARADHADTLASTGFDSVAAAMAALWLLLAGAALTIVARRARTPLLHGGSQGHVDRHRAHRPRGPHR